MKKNKMTTPLQVLLIEHNQDDARLIRNCLKDGYPTRLIHATNLNGGLERLKEALFDLILFDAALPDCQGWESLLKLQENDKDAAIVMLVNSDDEEIGIGALQRGAQDYLVKNRLNVSLLVQSIRNAIEKKQAERAMARVNRALRTLSECNESIVRAQIESDLLHEICRVIVEIGGYRMIWVGYTENDEYKSVKPVAYSGVERGFLYAVPTTWGDCKYGQGPTGTAIRTHQPCIKRDILNDPDFSPWRAEALKRDYISAVSLPLIHRDSVFGALTVYASEQDAFDDDEMELLTELAGDLAYGIYSLRMQSEREKIAVDLEKNYKRLRRVLEQTVNSLSSILAKRDLYTSGHQTRVARLACAMAKEMMLTNEQIEGLRVAGMLHDIGKIYIPAEILSKPSGLTGAEFEIMKVHPQAGYDIIQTIEFPWPVAQMVLQHHERMNGSGYPRGLAGEQILTEARILAVADVIEAMSSHRPYRPAHGIDAALDEITMNRGLLYDAAATDACLRLFREKGYKLE